MNRLLSSIGIGAATVDTRLPTTTVVPGEAVEATVELTGGTSDQAIDGLSFALLTRRDGEDRVVDTVAIAEPFTLSAGESRTIETSVTVPPWTPLTRDGRRVWLKTGLDVAWAVDPDDEDDIDVVAGPYLEALFAAVEELGFESRGSELREPAWLDDRPFAQAFAFVPRPAAEREDIERLTIVADPHEDDLKTVVEIDEREPAEAEHDVAFDQQEVVKHFDTADASMVRRQLRTTLDRHTNT